MSEAAVINFNRQKLPSRPEGTSHKTEALCWAFMGTCGGAGVTSLCLQMAYELATSNHVKDGAGRICVFDLDMENGASLQYLDLEPVMTHEDLETEADRIDPCLLQSFMLSHASGFDVLAVAKKLDGNRSVQPMNILRLLDLISQHYDIIILDVPRLWNPWTHAAIGAADTFSLVTELNVPALQNVQSFKTMVKAKLESNPDINVIVNKHERRTFRNSVTLKDVKRAIGKEPEAAISVCDEHLLEAINRGEVVGKINPTSRYVREVRAMCEARLERYTDRLSTVPERLFKSP